jgi:hypothetical protein
VSTSIIIQGNSQTRTRNQAQIPLSFLPPTALKNGKYIKHFINHHASNKLNKSVNHEEIQVFQKVVAKYSNGRKLKALHHSWSEKFPGFSCNF